jgi:apolipoprotein N-acyltransferase
LTLAEALNPMIFPWALGHAQAPNLPLAQLAELGGVSLLTFVLASTNAVVADLVARPKREGAARRALFAAAILAILHLGGWLRMGTIDAEIAAAPQLKVGVVEANIGVKEKHNSRLSINNLLIHQRASQQLEQQGAELIVWPETMFSPPRTLTATGRHENRGKARENARLGRGIGRDTSWFPRSDAPLVDDTNADFAAGTSLADRSVPQRGFATPLLTGLVTMRPLTEQEQLREPPGAGNRMVYNSAVLLNAEGEVLGLADKKFLMPFSENFEAGRWLYYLTGVDLFQLPGMGDFAAGTEPVLLTNLTNDAWFGKTSEPALHFALARFRAIELRTTLIRSTNTGISGRVDPVGRLLEQTSLEGAETLLLDVPLMTARKTLFVLAGEWPAAVAAVLLAWLLVAARRRASRR